MTTFEPRNASSLLILGKWSVPVSVGVVSCQLSIVSEIGDVSGRFAFQMEVNRNRRNGKREIQAMKDLSASHEGLKWEDRIIGFLH